MRNLASQRRFYGLGGHLVDWLLFARSWIYYLIWRCKIVTNFVICVKLDVGMIWGVVARLLKLRVKSIAKRGGRIIVQVPQTLSGST